MSNLISNLNSSLISNLMFLYVKVGRDVMEINTSAGCADSELFRLTRQVKVDS